MTFMTMASFGGCSCTQDGPGGPEGVRLEGGQLQSAYVTRCASAGASQRASGPGKRLPVRAGVQRGPRVHGNDDWNRNDSSAGEMPGLRRRSARGGELPDGPWRRRRCATRRSGRDDCETGTTTRARATPRGRGVVRGSSRHAQLTMAAAPSSLAERAGGEKGRDGGPVAAE